ncbi:MAG TPA: DNA polymerase I [Gammaproteobacteria bacterium]|nr:DNA polymerase I [Gammaproteobacteria bacterium]
MNNNQKLVLVDGSSYLFRAYHGLPAFSNSKDEPCGAIYGVLSMIKRLQKDYPDGLMVLVFDAKGKTFRNDLYPAYKANRPPMPDDLRAQITPLHDILAAMGFPLLIVPNVEADDVIGTLAQAASKMQLETVISTGDKDMAQLVNAHVSLVNTMTGTYLNEKTVLEKFGVGPDRIVDYLALIGDKSDNIPGVPKVGPKTAVKWLNQYGSMENIMAHADEIKGKVGENLRASLMQLPLSYELATIKCDVPLDCRLDDLQMRPVDRETLIDFFTRYEFRNWLREVLDQPETSSAVAASEVKESNYDIVLDELGFEQWIKKLEQAALFSFDTETNSLDYINAEIIGVSFSVCAGEAAYVPVGHNYSGAPDQLGVEYVLRCLKPLLEDSKKAKLGQNLKFDMSVLARYGIAMRGIAFDTMLESYVLDSVATRHDMDSLALKYLNKNTTHFEDIAGKGAKQKTFNQIELEIAGPYAAEDADVTLQLHEKLWPELSQLEKLRQVFENIELPLISVLSKVERNGVLIDPKLLDQQTKEISKTLQGLEAQAYDVAGETFNLNSPKQIQKIFFEKLALPIIKKTPKGQPSTAEAVLQALAEDYELPRLILDYRGLSKLKSTYTDKLPGEINPTTGRVHTSYHQAVAATGRLSSSNPNLQNIPIRSAEGRRIRQAFVAPQDCKLIAADYSQIELRIMAHLSADGGLLSAFNQNKDIHRATAADIFSVNLAEVSHEQRRRAKAINFGLIYGMSAFGLAKQLSVGRNEAQDYMDEYFRRYPGVKRYMEETREIAKMQGYVETLFGRRLYLPEINAKNAMRRQYAERTAINAPMQGTAADIIKIAMIATDQWINEQAPQMKMIMQVHDELVFEVPDKLLETAKTGISACMESAAELAVPLIVDIGVGDNWDEAH